MKAIDASRKGYSLSARSEERGSSVDSTLMKYHAFLAVADAGSFTRAAETLGYTQSGVSRMIADLEREWKVKLLERSRTGVRLTSEGTELIGAVRSVVDEQGRLQARIDGISGLKTGLIRIGTVSSVGAHWLPNIIKHFREDYPHIDCEITTGYYTQVERAIAQGEVDCGFVRLPTQHPFDTIFLEREEMKVVMPEGHPLAVYDRVPVELLSEYPFVTNERSGDSDIAPTLAARGLQAVSHITTWDDYAVFAMVEAGLGISVQPELILRRIPFRVVSRGLDEPVKRDIALALPSRENAQLAVKRFIEYLTFRNE